MTTGPLPRRAARSHRARLFRFGTKDYDAEPDAPAPPASEGLYYYGYRYYSPRLGRWMSTDPIEELGGLNLYGSLRNRPTTVTDPVGRISVSDCNAEKNEALSDPEVKAAYDKAKNAKDWLGIPCLGQIKCMCCLAPVGGFYNPLSRDIGLCANRLGAGSVRKTLHHELIHASSICGWWKPGCRNCMIEEKRAYYLSGYCHTDDHCSSKAWGSCKASLSCGWPDRWENYRGVGWPVRK